MFPSFIGLASLQGDLKCYWSSRRCAVSGFCRSTEFLLRNNLMLLLSWAKTQLAKSREITSLLNAFFCLFQKAFTQQEHQIAEVKVQIEAEKRWLWNKCNSSKSNFENEVFSVELLVAMALDYVAYTAFTHCTYSSQGYLLSLLLLFSRKLPPLPTSWVVFESCLYTHSSLKELDLFK